MTIRVAIRHRTEYRYDRRISLSAHEVRLRPAAHSRTPIHAYSLRVAPDPHFINWQQDPFGNYIARLVFPEKVDHLTVDVEVIADMTVINPFDFFLDEQAQRCPFEYPAQLRKELAPYLERREDSELLRGWLQGLSGRRQKTVDFLVEVNQRLQKDINYRIRMEPGVQSCEETLATASGSCRDSGWLLVQILRHLGLAARFCSGYLVQLTADMKSLDGPSGPSEDFTDLHAWCEVFVPGAGWIGLDPTSGLFAGEGHIPLACAPDPVSAAPITGNSDPCETEFSHSNTVTRIHEDPRVTKPYTEAQWACIHGLGQMVDRELDKMDVRLTLGGEPTFVSIDDMESAQWNTAALGDHKLRLAKDLLLRLRDRFAANGVLHYGQGKWYPGEILPRWALGCFWRADGEPLWTHPQLLARVDRPYGFDSDSARRFATALAERLGIDTTCLRAAFEDAFYHIWQEQQLPVNVDPQSARLDDPLERRRIARLLRQGLSTPAGYVLPLAWEDRSNGWRSCHWKTRQEALYLLPGDSPMGYRLPLDTLRQTSRREEAMNPPVEPDPFAPRPPLPSYTPDGTDYRGADESAAGLDHEDEDEEETIIRTSLCVEIRDGRLYVFLPPVTALEQYLLLLRAIEDTAADLDMAVVIEGYEPPADHRLRSLKVTPDPGVIEVNIHPGGSWQELVETTRDLYALARDSRLGTEKFMLDGRHTGTGGGNHVTLGGPTPADSPLLRRPDLLRSLITYWQHHPALSYLFSGMFIGPTSQAPRVDEGRAENLYELEIAFQQLPTGESEQPWLVDRALRHLLVDITGNTHRSEFCIDKLYSPDSAAGRQGLLEFRAFEMPPHAQMSLVQMLLLRILVARFWRAPYSGDLIRWGTALHDRFMLPHFIWRDMADVINDLRQQGYPFQLEWLAPFAEYRFPHYGRVAIDDIGLELRMAIEPWHVLGEETSSFGTARYVDSSVERLQVRLTGLIPERYALSCNGCRVPLHHTGTHGEYVAGVRYRAWQPPSALHPTIEVHVPLVFDIIDTLNGRSIGGCTYHVSHPGGLSYDSFPVNAFAAESRRINRFWDYGHTPGPTQPPPDLRGLVSFVPHGADTGPIVPPAPVPDPEYPYTLDLRKAGPSTAATQGV